MKVALPFPFGVIFKSILASPPVADSDGALPVPAFAIVNSLTADPVVVNLICSLEFSSIMPLVLSIIIFCAFLSKVAESYGE